MFWREQFDGLFTVLARVEETGGNRNRGHLKLLQAAKILNFRLQEIRFSLMDVKLFELYWYCREFIVVLGIYMKVLRVLLQFHLHVGADLTFDFSCFNRYCHSNTDDDDNWVN